MWFRSSNTVNQYFSQNKSRVLYKVQGTKGWIKAGQSVSTQPAFPHKPSAFHDLVHEENHSGERALIWPQ